MEKYINLTEENIEKEHICCAISSNKKHTNGVNNKKTWIKEKLSTGHVFRKLNANGKVFIEYEPIETAWAPIEGKNFLYIYCLWVSGSYTGKGYAKELLEYCIADAKAKNKSGICILSSTKKKPFISEKGFFLKYGFKVVDKIQDYELLALSFAETTPSFNETSRKMEIENEELTIYYSPECPYISDCIREITEYTTNEGIKLVLESVDTLEKVKSIPCVFNNWAVFYKKQFKTTQILNVNSLKKLLEQNN